MKSWTLKAHVSSVLVLAAATAGPALAQTWQQTTAGTYSWTTAANWDTAFPNAAGATANFNIAFTGDQIVNLNQAITLGTLDTGDTIAGVSGTYLASLTINSGTGGYPLTFQGASPGAATALNFVANFPSNPAAPDYLVSQTIASGIVLGGTSPLTVTLSGAATADVVMGGVNLNGNTMTVAGPGQPAALTNPNQLLDPGVITGNGAVVVNGGAVGITHNLPNFTGTLTVNNGTFGNGPYNLSSASQYVVGGVFQQCAPWPAGASSGIGQFPVGGCLSIGSQWPAVSTLPDRLNHNGVIVMNGGGYLCYAGQALVPSLAGSAVKEQVKQMVFNPGLSEISIQGALGSGATDGSVTLLANSTTNACVRNQGATLLIGGDNGDQNGGTFWTALGGVENLQFASGMSQYLVGGGGSPGSQNVSIVPWMLGSMIYHPGQGRMVTYGPTGVRCLTLAEYYTTLTAQNTVAVYGAPSTANVASNLTNGAPDADNGDPDLNLGTNHTQTINALSTESYGNSDIGAGSTLTITSGFVQFASQGGSIGATPGQGGTLNFGSHEGIIYTTFKVAVSPSPNQIGSVIAGSGGLTTAGTNVLILTAANTYTGKTTVGSGTLQIGDGTLTTSHLGNGDVEVVPGATLSIMSHVANAISDSATVTLDQTGNVFYAQMILASGINETVGGLVLGGVAEPAGTYGSSSSSATYKNDNYFSGPGILTVVPEPAALPALAAGALLLSRRRR